MDDGTVTPVPSGWYDDPTDPWRLRYWDGRGWTEHTAPTPPGAPGAMPAPSAPAAPVRSSAVSTPASTEAILSIVFSALAWVVLPFVGAILGVVFGHRARRLQAAGGSDAGAGLATAGLVLGYLQLALVLLLVVVAFVFLVAVAAGAGG